MKGGRSDGFTLIEVLVALSLVAMMGVIAWRGLDYVAEQRSRMDAEVKSTERVLRTLAQIERDVTQRIPDSLFADSYGSSSTQSLALDVASDKLGRVQLRVLRRHPTLPDVQTIVYFVENGQLVRRIDAHRAAAASDGTVLLEAVQGVEVRFLAGGRWVEPELLAAATARATAIEVVIELGVGERYVELVQL